MPELLNVTNPFGQVMPYPCQSRISHMTDVSCKNIDVYNSKTPCSYQARQLET